ncbi:RNA 2',3'-cyclic phosphodiesterase [Oligoflexia bacterium]|nr:RNA 2',3'-cyclic phosphodiesterase [Oligoflexia bacterium]
MRLFIAIELGEEIQNALNQHQVRLQAHFEHVVRFPAATKLHLTLKFLGDIEDNKLTAIKAAIAGATAQFSPFKIILANSGCFPPEGKVKIVWTGIHNEDKLLEQYQQALEEQLQEIGFPLEARAFTPHITIGRATRTKDHAAQLQAPLRTMVAKLKNGAVSQEVKTIALIRSTLSSSGAEYETIYTAKLNGNYTGRQSKSRVMIGGEYKEEVFDPHAATKVPANILLGCSTWTYPGWKGLVYQKDYKSEKEFKNTCLEEYAVCPLFRTVGIDRTFYAPPTKDLLTQYATMVPDSFRWVSKVWERLTIPKYPAHARYGTQAGKENSDFLNARLFINRMLPAYRSDSVLKHTGPFVFQFPTINKELLHKIDFLNKLHAFLSALPTDFQYATEIRNPELLGQDYFGVLNTCSATHCFNHWNYMPSLKEQMQRAASAGGLKANFLVARLLTPRGVSYQQAVERFKPYDTLKHPNPTMRQDVVTFAKRAIKRNATAFIIVNNRAEGNSPLTINAISKMLVATG